MSDYDLAINSAKWFDEVRPAVLDRDHHRCRFCGCTNDLQVHHIRYDDFFNPEYLVTLCDKCHQIVTNAVKKAKQMEIQVILRASDADQIETIKRKAKNAIKDNEQDLLVCALFEVWKRTLDDDCDAVNLRNLDILKPIGAIIRASMEYQAGLPVSERGFTAQVRDMISRSLAKGYNYYRGEGFTDYFVQRFLKLTDHQMAETKRHAEKLLKDGAGASG